MHALQRNEWILDVFHFEAINVWHRESGDCQTHHQTVPRDVGYDLHRETGLMHKIRLSQKVSVVLTDAILAIIGYLYQSAASRLLTSKVPSHFVDYGKCIPTSEMMMPWMFIP